jgi:hypothetical protein
VLPTVAIAYNCSVLIVFSLLTTIMIGIFGWIVFLWDIDRLFFKLENKIDSQMMVMEMKSGESGQDGTLLGRAREMLNNIVQSSRRHSRLTTPRIAAAMTAGAFIIAG